MYLSIKCDCKNMFNIFMKDSWPKSTVTNADCDYEVLERKHPLLLEMLWEEHPTAGACGPAVPPAGWTRSGRSDAAPWWTCYRGRPVGGRTSAGSCYWSPCGPGRDTDTRSAALCALKNNTVHRCSEPRTGNETHSLSFLPHCLCISTAASYEALKF